MSHFRKIAYIAYVVAVLALAGFIVFNFDAAMQKIAAGRIERHSEPQPVSP